MSLLHTPIQSWTDGHHALRSLAESTRGAVTLYPGTPTVARWPRTTRFDALAIVMVFDDAVHRFAEPPIIERWRGEIDRLVSEPDHALAEAHPHNRALWDTLADVAAHLDHRGAPLPTLDIWDRAARELTAHPATQRFSLRCPEATTDDDGEVPIGDPWDKVAHAHRGYFRALRGEEAGASPLVGRIPRTTNRDVLLLATFWTEQLVRAGGHLGRDLGDRVAIDRWESALADVSRLARGADPEATYPQNLALWEALTALSIQAAGAAGAPIVDRHAEPARNAAPVESFDRIEFPTASSWDEAAAMQKAALSKRRGEDIVPGNKFAAHVPRTTNGDVAQLAAYWTTQLALVGGHHWASVDYRDKTARWRAAVDQVWRTVGGANLKALYPHNAEFWTALIIISVHVSVTAAGPSKWTLFLESLEDTLDKTPGRIIDALQKAPEVAVDALQKAPEVAAKAVELGWHALASALLRPAVYVGGGILGLLLLLRSTRSGSGS
jgi:hypothetical protein